MSKILLLLIPFLANISLTASKNSQQLYTPRAPRPVRLDSEERYTIIQNHNPYAAPLTYAPQQKRMSRQERVRKINSMLVGLKSGSRSPSPRR